MGMLTFVFVKQAAKKQSFPGYDKQLAQLTVLAVHQHSFQKSPACRERERSRNPPTAKLDILFPLFMSGYIISGVGSFLR